MVSQPPASAGCQHFNPGRAWLLGYLFSLARDRAVGRCQALRLGLVDQVLMNVVPVVFGSGRPFLGATGAGDVVPLDNPTHVVRGDRV